MNKLLSRLKLPTKIRSYISTIRNQKYAVLYVIEQALFGKPIVLG